MDVTVTGRLGGIQTKIIRTGTHRVAMTLQKVPTLPRLKGRSGSASRPTRRRSVCGIAKVMLLNKTAEVRMELKAVELARYSNPYKPMNASANKVARAGNFILVSTCEK